MSLPDPKNPKPQDPGSSDSEAQQQEVVKFAKEQPVNTSVMPTMLGVGYGTYQQRPENFLLSFVTHTAGLGLMLWLLHLTVSFWSLSTCDFHQQKCVTITDH